MTDIVAAMRDECQRMIKELKITQAELIRKATCRGVYTITPAEMSNSLNGLLNTPKGISILGYVYALLLDEQKRTQIRNRSEDE